MRLERRASRCTGRSQTPAELDRERLGRGVSPAQVAVGVTRDERERSDLGPRQRLDDEIGGLRASRRWPRSFQAATNRRARSS